MSIPTLAKNFADLVAKQIESVHGSLNQVVKGNHVDLHLAAIQDGLEVMRDNGELYPFDEVQNLARRVLQDVSPKETALHELAQEILDKPAPLMP